MIRPQYFHLIGWTIFARPTWSLAAPVSVSFDDVPKGWSFASDLEHGNLTHRQAARERFGRRRLSGVEGGHCCALRFAGSWGFSDEAFIKRLEPIIASHHRFWGDPMKPFLVTVLPLLPEPGSTSLGGTGLSDAFAFFSTPNVDDRMLTRILAHEHLHSWIPRRVGMMPQENNDSLEYWFSEGFTDFYTYRLLVRDGLWSLEETAKALNDVMWDYAFSPARNATNADVAASFWSDRAKGDIPYHRGLLFAALADDRVRRASKAKRDLDDVMLAMKRAADAAGPARHAAADPRAVRDVDERRGRRCDRRHQALHRAAAKQSRCPAIRGSPAARSKRARLPNSTRGFDGPRTIANNNVVTGVDPNGPAYAAGLRDGMRIRKLDLSERRDLRVALTYSVFVDGGTREISYLPAGKRKVTLQEFKLKPMSDEASRKACAVRLGGNG